MVKGKLIKKDNVATFITSEKVLNCDSCNGRITNCDIIFVCQTGRKVFCICHAEPKASGMVCNDSKYKEHWHQRAKMEVEA